MSDTAIRVEDISKRYKIGVKSHDTIKDLLASSLNGFFRRSSGSSLNPQLSTLNSPPSDYIWALKDVSFDVKRGETLGIIGANGAGKSTLLKILSRITEPTSGRAEVYGRVGSLLEVGTGFHGELTGRENIYLNGAVLGMRKVEIDRKFDEIVDFSGVEKFIDTPVKRYSSGMYVRLAFAVAAHLEPEIMIVDEVLAVGDAEFQKKCLGKMGDVAKEGRTVLFVSHNMDAMQRLCSRCFLLEDGKVISQGTTASTVTRYLSSNSQGSQPNKWIDVSHATRTGTGEARFVAVRYSSLKEDVAFQPYSNGPLEFALAIESDLGRSVGSVALSIFSRNGTLLVNADTISLGQVVNLRKGQTVVTMRIEGLYLNPGVYVVGLWLANPIDANSAGKWFDCIQSAFELEVVNLTSEGFGIRPNGDGVVVTPFQLLEVSDRISACPETRTQLLDKG